MLPRAMALVALGLIACSHDDAPVDAADGAMVEVDLVAWYRFEGLPVIDSSGHGHDGSCDEGTTCPTIEPGVDGSAAHFDGVDDVITVAYTSGLDFDGPFTVALWIWIDALDPAGVPVARAYADTSEYSYALWHDDVGGAYFGTWNALSDTRNWLLADTSLAEGEWIHVAGVYDGASKCLFVNGISDCEIGPPTAYGDNPLTLGAGPTRSGSNPYQFDGLVDEVRIYSRALTASEIATLATR